MAFVPQDFQAAFQPSDWITAPPPATDDDVVVDVLFVGGGPAGLAGAYTLAQQARQHSKELEIAVLEKAATPGGHNLSGAVVQPETLYKIFGRDKKFPFRHQVQSDRVYWLGPQRAYRLPTPPSMHNKGNYTLSICELMQWMAHEVEQLGVHVLTSFAADKLLFDEQGVRGVLTTPMGLNRKGEPGPQYTPPTAVRAGLTVLTEGTRGPLSRAYQQKLHIPDGSPRGGHHPKPQIFALGVKELWSVPKPLKSIVHTMGWPLQNHQFGGSFIYPMGQNEEGRDLVSLGLVVGLDARPPADGHALLQQLKQHPFVQKILQGPKGSDEKRAELLEWGAKTIPEGGWHAFPSRLYGDGLLMAGDCVGMVNVPSLKGIHYAMEAGRLAGLQAFKAYQAGSFKAQHLAAYDAAVRQGFIGRDLKKVRNMRPAFVKGFWSGAWRAACMSLTKGRWPNLDNRPLQKDAQVKRELLPTQGGGTLTSAASSVASKIRHLSKQDAVYKSGNSTRDDGPSHLQLAGVLPEEVGRFYAKLCPAGVYEWKDNKLVVNAPNCVDCKATDVLGPRWLPREGGSGPAYKKM